MRFTRRAVEHAAVLCALRASGIAAYMAAGAIGPHYVSDFDASQALGASRAAVLLAASAADVTVRRTVRLGLRDLVEAYAEAEARIRTGWRPRQ